MDNDDVKQQALEQAQQAYGLFIWFVKWFSYVMIFMIVLMFMNNWFDDGTGSMFMPDEIYEDQYDPKGLNKKNNYPFTISFISYEYCHNCISQ